MEMAAISVKWEKNGFTLVFTGCWILYPLVFNGFWKVYMKIKCKTRVIIKTILVVLEYWTLYTKLHSRRKKKILKDFAMSLLVMWPGPRDHLLFSYTTEAS